MSPSSSELVQLVTPQTQATEVMTLQWSENDSSYSASYFSESETPRPKSIHVATDELTAHKFIQKTSEGAVFVWRGDFQNARQLLQAVERRLEKKTARKRTELTLSPLERFHLHRKHQAEKSRMLGRLLIPLNEKGEILLPRAPRLSATPEDFPWAFKSLNLVSLREVLGLIGALEWQRRGIEIPFLEMKIHSSFGVFAPVRREYLQLVQEAPLPPHCQSALDVGTGTGVLAFILAKRGIPQVVATESEPRALAAARRNLLNLKEAAAVQLVAADLWPDGKFDLVVCNPPWLPVRPTSRMERAVYDENGQMIERFLKEVSQHLTAKGEVWLVISNFAEILGLRPQNYLSKLFAQNKLEMIGKHPSEPTHKKAKENLDPLYQERRLEITTLYRLKVISSEI